MAGARGRAATRAAPTADHPGFLPRRRRSGSRPALAAPHAIPGPRGWEGLQGLPTGKTQDPAVAEAGSALSAQGRAGRGRRGAASHPEGSGDRARRDRGHRGVGRRGPAARGRDGPGPRRARTKARGLAVGVSGPCGHGAPRACERVRVSVRGLRPCAGPYGCGRQPQGTWRGWAFPACKGPRRGPRGHGCDSWEQVPGVEAASPTGACRGLGAPALGSEATAGWSPRLVAAQRARAYLLTAGMLLHTCTAFCGALPPASRMVTGSPWGGTAAVGRGHLGRAHGPRPPCEPRMALGIRAAASPGRLRARPRCLQVTSLSL